MRQRFEKYVTIILIALMWAAPSAAADSAFLAATNNDRVAVSVAPLAYNAALNSAAAAKLADMQAKGYWAHVSPDGHDAGYFIDASGYQWVAWAENLAEGYTTSTAIVAAWMNSPGHKTNMLNANYRDVGFALGAATIGGQSTILSVAIYGSTIRGTTAPITSSVPVTPVPVASKPAPAVKASSPVPSLTRKPLPSTSPTPLAATQMPTPSPFQTSAKPRQTPTATNIPTLTKGAKTNSPADRYVAVFAIFCLVFGSAGLLAQFLKSSFGGR